MPKVSKDRHRREHHRSSNDPDRRVHKDNSRAEAHPKPPPTAKLPKESLGTGLSGDDGYVRRWLAQTESDTIHDDALVTREAISSEYLLGYHFQSRGEPLLLTSHLVEQERSRTAHAELQSRHTPLDPVNVSRPSKRKKAHDPSSDSSLLEAPIRLRSHQSKRDEPRAVTVKQPEDPSTPARKRQRIAPSDSGLSGHVSTPIPPKETFEKRPRHKTREDKYEPKKKKEKKQKKASVDKTSSRKREKKGDRKKGAAKKAGDELIQNFSSNNISQDRLTVSTPAFSVRNRLILLDPTLQRSWIVQQWQSSISSEASRT